MADATTFNVADGLEVERKLLTTWVNTGTTAAKVWECVGVGVEDSSIEMNVDKSKLTDILGVTRTKINKMERVQSFDPMTVRGGSDLQVKLHNQIRYDRLAEMSAYEVMIVTGYVGAAVMESNDPTTKSEPLLNNVSQSAVSKNPFIPSPIAVPNASKSKFSISPCANSINVFNPSAKVSPTKFQSVSLIEPFKNVEIDFPSL